MSQQQRLIQLPLIGTVLLCLLIGIYLAASKRFSKPDPAGKVRKHTVKTRPDEALAYWTAKKKRQARPAEMPKVDDLKQGKQHS